MIYKIANTVEEYEQIFKLNYETFVDEIPQHEKNETKKFVHILLQYLLFYKS